MKNTISLILLGILSACFIQCDGIGTKKDNRKSDMTLAVVAINSRYIKVKFSLPVGSLFYDFYAGPDCQESSELMTGGPFGTTDGTNVTAIASDTPYGCGGEITNGVMFSTSGQMVRLFINGTEYTNKVLYKPIFTITRADTTNGGIIEGRISASVNKYQNGMFDDESHFLSVNFRLTNVILNP